jgi:hypothetical protein
MVLTILTAVDGPLYAPHLTNPFYILAAFFVLQGTSRLICYQFSLSERICTIFTRSIILLKIGVVVHIYLFGIMVSESDYKLAAVKLLLWVGISVGFGFSVCWDIAGLWGSWSDSRYERKRQQGIEQQRRETAQKDQEIARMETALLEDLADFLTGSTDDKKP